MSRENSLEDVKDHTTLPAASLLLPGEALHGRKTSKSVSNVRPSLTTPQRTKSYHAPSLSASSSTMPMPSLLSSPTDSTTINPRKGLKRRISTPSLVVQREEAEAHDAAAESVGTAGAGTGSKENSRARSTSTSIVVPEDLLVNRAGPSNYAPSGSTSAPPYKAGGPSSYPTPPNAWAPIFVTPASPEDGEDTTQRAMSVPHPRRNERSTGILNSAYDLGEASLQRLARWVRPQQPYLHRRGSDDDSEKGLDADEDLDVSADSSGSVARTSEDSLRRNGRYWGMWDKSDQDEDGYFSLPPTPPEEKPPANLAEFEAALAATRPGVADTLPTPALSTKSLSRMGSSKRDRSRRRADARDAEGAERDGWLSMVVNLWRSLGNGRRSGGKTGEVLRDLGWTVALLVGLFVVTGATALWMIQAMPM